MRQADNLTSDDDHRLVSLCQKGDLGAFEELVKRHEKQMLNIAYRIIGNYEEACDVVQEAFVSAYKNIKNFKGMSKFSTWLSAIVINHSKKSLKELQTQHFREPVSIDKPIDRGEDQIMVDPQSSDPMADEILEREEIHKKVQSCLERLDSEFREVVVLRDIQGFSYEDIVSILKIAEGTVKSRLFRARMLLKNCLKGFMGVI